MTFSAISYAPAEPGLRVERVFADTYALILRQGWTYLWLTLAFGVLPGLLVPAVLGLPPGDLSKAPVAAKLISMALFVLGDAALSGALARLVLDEAAGVKTSLWRSLDALRGRALPLLLAAAAIDAPILALNLAVNVAPHDPATGLALYGLRFLFAMTLGAIWAGCGAAIVAEPGLDARGGLARAARLTRGERPQTALFFAAFFILKVLGPYLLIEVGLQRLTARFGDGGAVHAASAVAGIIVWNLLACALGVSAALIYVRLRALKGQPV